MKKTIYVLILSAHLSELALAGSLRKLTNALGEFHQAAKTVNGRYIVTGKGLETQFNSRVSKLANLPHLKSLVNNSDPEKATAFAEPIFGKPNHFFANHIFISKDAVTEEVTSIKLVKFEIPESTQDAYSTTVKTYPLQLFSNPNELKKVSKSPEVFSVTRKWSKESAHATQDYYIPVSVTEGGFKQDYRVKLYSQDFGKKEDKGLGFVNIMNDVGDNFQSLRFTKGAQVSDVKDFKEPTQFYFRLLDADFKKDLKIVDFSYDSKKSLLTVTTNDGKVQDFVLKQPIASTKQKNTAEQPTVSTNPNNIEKQRISDFKPVGEPRYLGSKLDQSLFAEIKIEHGIPVKTNSNAGINDLEIAKPKTAIQQNAPSAQPLSTGNNNTGVSAQ